MHVCIIIYVGNECYSKVDAFYTLYKEGNGTII